MKSQGILLAILLIASGFVPLGLSDVNAQTLNNSNFGETKSHVVILFNDKVSQDKLDLIKANGGEITRTYKIINGLAANLPAKAIQNLKNNPSVISIDPDVEFHAIELDADTRIGASQVWTLGTNQATGNGVRVAILDTGIDTDNVEFGSGRIIGCHSEMGISEPTCEDLHGHGTHVAGIIGAGGVDSAAKGVAYDVSYLIDKVLAKNGSGSLDGIIAGIDWAVTNNAQVISMSLGTSAYSDQSKSNCDTWYPTMTSAVNNAVLQGVTVVVAAGNSDISGVGLPACISNTIAVAAVNDNDSLASFSSIGGAVKDHGISAPGVNIYSSLPGNTYASWSGTSMATPVVTGSIALLLEDHPSMTPASIKNALFSTACTGSTTPSCPTGAVPNISYGYGRVDVLRALNSIISSPTPTVPSIPQNLSATPVSTSQINLSWSVPTSNGGSAITDYKIEYKQSSSGTWLLFSDGTSTTPSAAVTGLASGVSYDFRVSAVNVIGTGSPSNVATATTQTAPSLQLSVSSITAQTIKLSSTNKKIETTVIVNSGGNSISGASVSVKTTIQSKIFTGSGITDITGKVVIMLGPMKYPAGTSYESCTTNVSLAGYIDGAQKCTTGKTL